MFLWLLSWALYGLLVGLLARALHPGLDSVGFFATIFIGIMGSYIGGALSWILGFGELGSPSGIFMGVVGAIVFLWLNKKIDR